MSNWKVYTGFVRRYGRRFLAERAAESGLPVIPAPHRPEPSTWSDRRLTVAWLGHATLLINFYGTWLLTDPALRWRVGIRVAGATLGPRRLVRPALTARELPKVDAVLISHAHMDHCDSGTLRQLPRQTRAITQLGNGDLLQRFSQVDELVWGASTMIGEARIEAVAVNHWGARTLTDTHRGYGGFLIEKRNRTLLFAGDTAYTKTFAALTSNKLTDRRRSHIDLAVLPIGAYDPYIHVHANPEQAWAMRDEMNATYILPIHHSTFRLSREPTAEPITRLLAAADDNDERWRIAVTEIGQTWVLPENE